MNPSANHPTSAESSAAMQDMQRQLLAQFMQSFADFEMSTRHRLTIMARAGVTPPNDVMNFCFSSLLAIGALVEPAQPTHGNGPN